MTGKSRKLSTLVGCGSLFIWSVEAIVVAELVGVPVFEALAIVFFASFALTAAKLTLTRQWLLIKQPVYVWILGVLGICGSDLAYVLAFRYAPPAHVDLIDYLWPLFVIIFSSVLPTERFTWGHALGGSIGLLGILLLITDGQGFSGFHAEYFFGYGIALVGMLMWGTYSVFSAYHKHVPSQMIGMYCLVGMLICLVLHLQFETTVIPTFSEWVLAFGLGLAGAGLAYQLWDHGAKFGDLKLMSLLTYCTPVLSMTLLVWFDKAEPTVTLWIACVLVTIGVGLGTCDWEEIKSKLLSKKSPQQPQT